MKPKSDLNLSRTLCYILRHNPQSCGLTPDPYGWVPLTPLLSQLNTTLETIQRIVFEDNKQRYQLKLVESNPASQHPFEYHIRTCQGHSFPISFPPEAYSHTPPETLFHGTTLTNLAPIKTSGLIPQSRQLVHLTSDLPIGSVPCFSRGKPPSRHTAIANASRWKNSSPVILHINATAAHALSPLILSDNNVWLSSFIPLVVSTAKAVADRLRGTPSPHPQSYLHQRHPPLIHPTLSNCSLNCLQYTMCSTKSARR